MKNLQKQISYLSGSIIAVVLFLQLIFSIDCSQDNVIAPNNHTDKSLLKITLSDSVTSVKSFDEVDSLRFILSSDSLVNSIVYTFAYSDKKGVVRALPVNITVNIRIEGLSSSGMIMFSGTSVCSIGTDSVTHISFSSDQISPLAPDNAVAVAQGPDSITVTWRDNSNNEDYFVLEKAEGVSGEFSPVCSLTNAYYIDTDVISEGTYSYRIYAVNTVGESKACITNNVTTIAIDTIPPVISVLSSATNPDTTNKKILRLFGAAGDETGLKNLSITYSSVTDSSLSVSEYLWELKGILLEEGDNIFTLVASDNAGNIDSLVYTMHYSPLYVDSSNHPPVFSNIVSNMRATLVAGNLYTRKLVATDEDEFNTVSFKACSLLTVGDSGVVTWTPTNEDTGVVWLWALAVDQDGASDSIGWSVTVLDNSVNYAPSFVTSAASLLDSILVGATYADTLVAKDYDQDSGLVYSIVNNDKIGINSETGALLWVPTGDDLGTWPITAQVTDDSGATATISWVIRVYDPSAPVVFAGEDDTVSINDEVHLKGVASSLSGNPITKYEWDIGNTGNFVAGSRDTVFKAPSTPIDTLRCVFRVTDNGGNWNRSTVTITVLKDAPVPDAGEDQVIQIKDTFDLKGSATDVFGTITKWEWNIGGSGFVTTSSGDTSGIIGPAVSGPYKCILRVTDDDGNIATDEVIINAIGSTMRVVTGPNGADQITFNMGSTDGSKDETPVHTVTISSFMIDSTEVSQGEYIQVMKTVNPSAVNPSANSGDINRPVEQVTWFDAVLYCNARSQRDGFQKVYSYTDVQGEIGVSVSNLIGLTIDYSKNGYRLPTEAEWEYACRGNTSASAYSWGNDSTSAKDYAWYDTTATSPVADKKGNDLFLYDMSGNVAEWVTDWYADGYTADSDTNPTGPKTGSFRVVRGGSWESRSANDLRSAKRGLLPPNAKTNSIGFRCVLPRQ